MKTYQTSILVTLKKSKIKKRVKRNNFSYSENHFYGTLDKYPGENLGKKHHVQLIFALSSTIIKYYFSLSFSLMYHP